MRTAPTTCCGSPARRGSSASFSRGRPLHKPPPSLEAVSGLDCRLRDEAAEVAEAAFCGPGAGARSFGGAWAGSGRQGFGLSDVEGDAEQPELEPVGLQASVAHTPV